MLEKSRDVTRHKGYKSVEYARFADDLVVLVNGSRYCMKTRLLEKVQLRLKQELAKLKVEINESKIRLVNLEVGETRNFCGVQFRLLAPTKPLTSRMAEQRPQREKRTEFLREIKHTMRCNRFKPVADMIRDDINHKIRGWVNYFRCGNSGRELNFVKSSGEVKVRGFATRQTRKKRGGRKSTTLTAKDIYEY